MKVIAILILVSSGYALCQESKDGVIYEENSVYFKEGKDKLILEDGSFYYGKFFERSGKKIIFQREFEAKKDTFMIKEIKLLVLSNGTTVVRDKKTIRMICSGISIYFIYYLSLLDISEIFN